MKKYLFYITKNSYQLPTVNSASEKVEMKVLKIVVEIWLKQQGVSIHRSSRGTFFLLTCVQHFIKNYPA